MNIHTYFVYSYKQHKIPSYQKRRGRCDEEEMHESEGNKEQHKQIYTTIYGTSDLFLVLFLVFLNVSVDVPTTSLVHQTT